MEKPQEQQDLTRNDGEEKLPSININSGPPAKQEVEEPKPLVSDQKFTDYCEEIIENLREDRGEATEMYLNFAEAVTNLGDATTSSKEALVNLLKLKTETNDRMIKVLDLWTRMKLKERDTFPRYLAVQQNNKITGSGITPQKKVIQMLAELNKVEDKDD